MYSTNDSLGYDSVVNETDLTFCCAVAGATAMSAAPIPDDQVLSVLFLMIPIPRLGSFSLYENRP